MAPKTKEQLEEIRKASRKVIMEAALELFGTRGYDGTSIEAIARKAGVAKGLIYNYFRSKEELLEQVVFEGFREFEPVIEQLLEIGDPRERLRQFIEISAQLIVEKERFYRLYTSTLLTIHTRKRLQKHIAEYFDRMLAELEKTLAEMGIEHPEVEAYTLSSLFDGLGLDYMIFGAENFPLRQIVENILKKYGLEDREAPDGSTSGNHISRANAERFNGNNTEPRIQTQQRGTP